MDENRQTLCTAFEGPRRLASGDLKEVALKAKKVIDRGAHAAVLIFDDVSSELIEVDFRGTAADVARRLVPATPQAEEPRSPGRPRLGVVAREVTLLPRHWDWLSSQPGGASVALRKLVERSAAHLRGPRPDSPGARVRLPFHVRHGRRRARLRGSHPGLVRRQPQALRRDVREVAQRCRRPRATPRVARALRPGLSTFQLLNPLVERLELAVDPFRPLIHPVHPTGPGLEQCAVALQARVLPIELGVDLG